MLPCCASHTLFTPHTLCLMAAVSSSVSGCGLPVSPSASLASHTYQACCLLAVLGARLKQVCCKLGRPKDSVGSTATLIAVSLARGPSVWKESMHGPDTLGASRCCRVLLSDVAADILLVLADGLHVHTLLLEVARADLEILAMLSEVSAASLTGLCRGRANAGGACILCSKSSPDTV